MSPLLSVAIQSAVAGFLIARMWNFAKRLWLYRSTLIWGAQRYGLWSAFTEWTGLAFMWFDPYQGEPSRNSLLRIL